MGNEVYSAVMAVGLGALVGIVLFVPFVALSYRRRGRLTFGRFVLWAAALVYFLAIWTYTLLPLPESAEYRCAGVNLRIAAFIEDLRAARSLTDVAVLQLALNVLLFVPLGFFIRVLGGRGILVSFFTGLGVSLVIETTQVTGVWGIFPCAYRVFDVDDLLMNTLGAVIGSFLAFIVPRRLRGGADVDAASRAHPVTRGRRLLAMLCDALGAMIFASAVGIGVQVVLRYAFEDTAAVIDGSAARWAVNLSPIVLWLIVVLVTGRTIGDLAVELRYRGGRVPQVLARPLRFLGGIGGYLLLSLIPDVGTLLQWAFAVVALIMVFTTAGGRGLPGILSGQRLSDAREDEVAAPEAAAVDAAQAAAGQEPAAK